MADSSYDWEESSLLCEETNIPCFFDLDSPATVEVTQETDGYKGFIFGIRRLEPLIDFPCLSEESFGSMVEREGQYMPKDDYLKRLRCGDLDLALRREALDWIWKAHTHYRFGDSSFCLSINYLDRFLSMYEMPNNKTWAVKLLSLACLSLAAKMEEINVPLTVDLQVGEPKCVFDGNTIQRMELLLLRTLQWRMQPYTPLTFIDHFLRKINGVDKYPSLPLISRSMQIISSTTKGIDFLEFRPSEIAAAVAMLVSADAIAAGEDIFKDVPCFSLVQKERVMKCVELIQDWANGGRGRNGSSSSSSTPQSPNGVLEAAWWSHKSDERAVGSCPDTKRRRLDTSNEGN